MATAVASVDLPTSPAAVARLVSDPTRLPAWDATYDWVAPHHPESAEEPDFEVHRDLAGRSMLLRCRLEEASPTRVVFAGSAAAGESAREAFELEAARDGSGTRLTRHAEFDFGDVDPIGVVPELTYTQAWLDRSVEQALDRLRLLLAGQADHQGDAPNPSAERRSSAS